MFFYPGWILYIVPRLWGFCKVPVPSASIGHKYVSHRVQVGAPVMGKTLILIAAA